MYSLNRLKKPAKISRKKHRSKAVEYLLKRRVKAGKMKEKGEDQSLSFCVSMYGSGQVPHAIDGIERFNFGERLLGNGVVEIEHGISEFAAGFVDHAVDVDALRGDLRGD